jgi:type IX secretion system PorP/SprF family membrane protein
MLTLWLGASLEALAQYDPSFSHYWAMEPSYNPGAIGKQDKINVAAAYNMTMTGFENNPRTMYAGADLPFYFAGSYHGAGLQFLNDQIGLFSHRKLALQYAIRIKLLGGRLAIGVQPGLLSENFNGSKVDLDVPEDNAFTKSEVTGTAFDLGAGLYYQRKSWYVGASVQHITAPTIELGETNELSLAQAYYFTAGCNIRLRNPFLTIHPTVLGRYDGVGYRGDISARLKYSNDKKVMYAGLGYSPTNSVTVMLGGLFHGITLGYSYEIYTTAISLGNGSHELFVGYQTDLSLFKKGRNRHQSVRIL